MGLLNIFKKPEPPARVQYEPLPKVKLEFSRTYENMNSFKGTKKIHVTTHGDKYGARENALSLVGDGSELKCLGSTIKLEGFKFDSVEGGRGIRVFVDALYVGVAWDHRDPLYRKLFKGDISGVYVIIEKNMTYEMKRGKMVPDRYEPSVSLYVLPSE